MTRLDPRLCFAISLFLMFTACKPSFQVSNVDYAHQLESVLEPDQNGNVTDNRHGLSFNIMPFQMEEFQDTSDVLVNEVRLIRNNSGYYFITADEFKHVYVMRPEISKLELEKKILINNKGLHKPAFNYRPPFIQLVETESSAFFNLNEKGIQNSEDNNQEEQS